MTRKLRQVDRQGPTLNERHNTSTSIRRVSPAKSITRAAAFLTLAAFSSAVSQLSLSPVYGSIPASLFHQRAVTFTALLAFVSRTTLRQSLPRNVGAVIPLLAFWIPTIQYFLFTLSSQLGGTYGPLITEACTFLPLLFLVMLTTGELLEQFDFSQLGPTVADMAPPMASYAMFSLVAKYSAAILPRFMSISSYFTRTGMQLIIASAYAILSPSKLILLAIPTMLHTALLNPHYTSQRTTTLLNSTLQAHDFALLERRESLTGYISVLESNVDQFRVLRCDHSLLGGEWLVTDQRQAQGQTTKEPIYQVFNMLEAVRLVETEDPRSDSEKTALVIGLGIGTSPSALIAHAINTTIVELDPAVYYFATKYFNLPSNHTAIIQDAVSFVAKAAVQSPRSYDYIIHDVFTGGAEPTALFTLEFLKDLSKLLSQSGVITINYAGDLASPSTQTVLNTIHTVFPTCRLFRDMPPDPTSPSAHFINMIVFCTKIRQERLKFRNSTEADYMGSLSRRQFLPPPESLEILYPAIGGNEGGGANKKPILRKGSEQELEKHQTSSALHHWKIMRTVLPDAVWENW